jgi:hypothetical protein
MKYIDKRQNHIDNRYETSLIDIHQRAHPAAGPLASLEAGRFCEEDQLMRFAVIATTVASLVGVPLVVNAASPQMNSAEFLSAVQCVAYENATSPNAADLGAVRWRLNAEAAKQPAEIAALAREKAQVVSAAVNTGAPVADLPCGTSRIADGARDRHAV